MWLAKIQYFTDGPGIASNSQIIESVIDLDRYKFSMNFYRLPILVGADSYMVYDLAPKYHHIRSMEELKVRLDLEGKRVKEYQCG